MVAELSLVAVEFDRLSLEQTVYCELGSDKAPRVITAATRDDNVH